MIKAKPSEQSGHNKTFSDVLNLESQALRRFSENPPIDFSGCIDEIIATKGRVIVSGIGKSGHVGRKICATLASTGTPSFFVHAAEASHGDLGMINPGDICILISNSGETSELSDIIFHCKRFDIPIIGISKNIDSTLMRAAKFRLLLPNEPEACMIGMAPTTSTTLTIALGDAVAVALMEARSFQAENFRTYHPGGKLGARLATVTQLMHTGDSIPIVNGSMLMSEVILIMTSRGFGVAGVVSDEGSLIGVVSDGDLRRNLVGLLELTANDVSSPRPFTIGAHGLAAEALALMNSNKITNLFVVDETHTPRGILHLHDLLRAGVA